MRAVPRDNESVNETWISDRDRFSYAGLHAADRLTTPMVKENGKWVATDWESAFTRVVEGLRSTAAEETGALLSPQATLEELYLAQKFLRALGVMNLDHRLRQSDFSRAEADPLFPYLGLPIEGLEKVNAALLVGSNVRKDQPIAHHRLRKAAMKGAPMMVINTRDYDFAFPVVEQIIADPHALLRHLAGVAAAAIRLAGVAAPASLSGVLGSAEGAAAGQTMAQCLKDAQAALVLMGTEALAHPQASLIRALCSLIAEHTGAVFGYLPEGANGAGAWLAGAVPHRGAAGAALDAPGRDATAMLA
jgi:NADH-quinone oxidoreductase subunit G